MSEVSEIAQLAKKPPIDFVRVDALRRRMLLTVSQMCELFGVSRVTYYSWIKGAPPRAKTEARVKAILRKLFWCITEHKWPTEDVLVADQDSRLELLIDLLNKFE